MYLEDLFNKPLEDISDDELIELVTRGRLAQGQLTQVEPKKPASTKKVAQIKTPITLADIEGMPE